MILGIESSCDESALAIFDPGQGILLEKVHTQIELHRTYGGVVPDLASREHLSNFPLLLEEFKASGYLDCLTTLAVTAGPGLAGCLATGLSVAKAISVYCGIPVLGVNHLRGHAFSPFIELHRMDPLNFSVAFQEQLPHLGLIVSGGNTILFSIDQKLRLRILAETLDDAAGEALDKGAKLMGFPYPGGPLIERYAKDGDSRRFEFPRSFLNSKELKFSFSGLKTSLRYLLEKLDDAELERVRADLCASYQQAVVDALVGKMRQVLRRSHWKSIGLSGGVANNQLLRDHVATLAERQKICLHIAEKRHSGDNAAMIAFAAFVDPENCQQMDESFALSFDPSWPLVEETI